MLYLATTGSTSKTMDDPRGLVFVWLSADGPTLRVGANYITPDSDDGAGIYILSSEMIKAASAAGGGATGSSGGLSGGAVVGAVIVLLAVGMAAGAGVTYGVAVRKGLWRNSGVVKVARSDSGSGEEDTPLFRSSSAAASAKHVASSSPV